MLAEIAGVLGRHQISIASVIQHEVEEGAERKVPLVIMTHQAPSGAVDQALQVIEKFAFVHPTTVRMRVRE